MNITDPTLPSEKGEHHKGHGANWFKWLHHLIGTPAVGIEFGTWKGESAEYMLDHFFTSPSSKYICVDTFEGSDEHHLGGIDCETLEVETRKRLERFGNRVEIFRSTSDHALRYMYRDTTFSMIYIDAAHDAMNVLRDSVLAFDLLTPGGIMIWDDMEWSVMDSEIDRPKIAIEAFLSCYARRLEVIGLGWQCAIRKIA